MEKDKKQDKQRSISQNNAIHLFCSNLAKEFNDAGLDMKKVLKPTVDIPWTTQTVKEYIWKGIQNAQLQKKSTTELTTKEVTEIYETINRHLGEKFELHVPFPSIEEILIRSL